MTAITTSTERASRIFTASRAAASCWESAMTIWPVSGDRRTVRPSSSASFVTPNYNDSISAAGVRYSFTGALDGPRRVQEGGYLSWRDLATGDWWQCDRVQRSQLTFRRLGLL